MPSRATLLAPLALLAHVALLSVVPATAAESRGLRSRGRSQSPMGALATATELLNGIGERFDDDRGAIDAEELLRPRRNAVYGAAGGGGATKEADPGGRTPHYSLFAPRHDVSAPATNEMRFRARAAEYADTDSGVTPKNKNSLDSFDASRPVDIVGSFVLLHQRGRTN